MKLFEIPMVVTSLVGLCILASLDAPAARADFTFGTPVDFTTIVPTLDPVRDTIQSFSPDGLEIYLISTRPGGYGTGGDIWVIRRDSLEAQWKTAESVGPGVNDPGGVYMPWVSADGLELYFMSDRPGGYGQGDLYVSARATRSDPWGQAQNLGPGVNGPQWDAVPTIAPDGLELYFTSDRPGGVGGFDIYVIRRATQKDAWGTPVNLGSVVNSKYDEVGPGLSPDGLLLLFQDYSSTSARPGGYGSGDIWMTRRTSLSDPWGPPVNLGPRVNGSQFETMARISSPDGSTLHVLHEGANSRSLQYPILPVVDFNGDESVDIQDLVLLIEHWGQADPHYDIGPMPWGDGKIDANDLQVLMRSWGQEFLDPMLVACWKLDEAKGQVAHDSAGKYEGVVHGDPVWLPAGGSKGGALQCDGVDDYISTDNVLDPAARPFSVFAWIKGGGPNQVILSQANGANWLMTGPGGTLRTMLQSPGRSASPLTCTTVITDGAWHQVGLVWTGARRILYVDRAEVARDEQVQAKPVSSTGGLNLGAASVPMASLFWSGLIDEVRVYKQVVTP